MGGLKSVSGSSHGAVSKRSILEIDEEAFLQSKAERVSEGEGIKVSKGKVR